MLCGASASATPPASEYQVKAAYLFNFGQFVEWPAEAYSSANAPFVIGVVGRDPFGKTLDDVVRGESLAGRQFVVRRFKDADDIDSCHILFIARSETARLAQALDAARGRNVLTVTDIEGAERRGAMIVLVNQDNRVRMRINLSAARASNLVISSNLLRPAQLVGSDEATP
ncbi:MAG TPA: YfiR family protein [Steroidobacteraceae bacterium]|nr:YfiR family protein [Steroidobacteraceae bacterium]